MRRAPPFWSMQMPESSKLWTDSPGLSAKRAGRALFFAVLLSGAACTASRPDIIQVGPWFPARSAADVRVFYSKEQVGKPFGAIAIIHSEKFSADDKAALERQKKEARKLAAGAGADGIIVVEETTMPGSQPGVYQEPETYISALAFKYVTDISTAAK